MTGISSPRTHSLIVLALLIPILIVSITSAARAQLNPQDPVFLPAVSYDWGGYGQIGTGTGVLVVADVNRDSKPDLVAADPSSGAIAVLLGEGDGTFLPAKTYESGSSSVGPLIVTDVNGDGKPDLIAATPNENSVSVLLGNGDGTFQAAAKYGTVGYGGAGLSVTDVNGDRKPDLIVTDAYPNPSVGVLLGNGDGTFGAAAKYDTGGYGAAVLTVTDVNGDRKPDLMVAVAPLNGNGSVGVMLGNGDGTFRPAVFYESGGMIMFLTLEDVNADGKLDVLVANRESNVCPGESDLGVMLGNGDGSFQPPATYCTGGYIAVYLAVTDVNNDGKQDVSVLDLCDKNCDSGDHNIGVLLGNGDGTFLPAQAYASGFETYSMLVADVNGDGNPDIVAAACAGSGVNVLKGNGDGTFLPLVNHDSGGYCPSSITLGDLNGDHDLDAVVANVLSGTIAVLLNSRQSPRTTTTLVSNLNPANPKKNVTYTATVTSPSGATLTGTVTFQDGTTKNATVPLAHNQAAFTTLYKTTGVHAITATYWGNAKNAGSAATLIEYIQRNSKTVVTTSVSPSRIGQPVTFTATVTSMTAAIPDGELVTFFDGTAPLASVALAGGMAVFTSSSLSAGKHIIKATYGGDVTFKPSTGKLAQVVTKYPTTTVLTSSLNPSAHGQPVTLTATVTPTGPYPPTGTVKFWDGTKSMGTVTLKTGVATLTQATLTVGTHSITAQYLGDAFSDKSTSPAVKQVVQ